ncbi:MAG: fibronectin type III domain-containing protein [Nitrospirae bacterium]|nr:fibronectin type III domain-containing protein [Nitrospirota bacterium]
MEPLIKMMSSRLCWLAFLLTALLPSLSRAGTCTPTVSAGESIQSAIDASSSGDTICVGIGTYTENITLKSGIILQGEELARTIIDGGDSGTVITGAESVSIYNITITSGDIGLSGTGITSLTISNVIVTGNSYGIYLSDSTSVTVSNAVIDQNTTSGIYLADSSVITILNSILTGNSIDISGDDTSSSYSGSYNLIYNNMTSYYYFDETTNEHTDTTSIYDQDPLFVNTASNDYHLQAGSPAIDTGTGTDPDGTPADMGAYGGAAMDTTPFPVSSPTLTASGSDTVSLSWSANNAYSIAGYKLYFDSDASGAPYDGSSSEGPSPIDAGNNTSFTLSGLSASGNSPSSPTGLTASPGDGTILLSWNAVNGASGYILYYGISSEIYSQTVDLGNTASYTLKGLTNGTRYYFAVSAYTQPTYYLVVTAYDTSGNESASANEVAAILTAKSEGARSQEVSELPEESIPFPILKDEGRCFIATAVYGSNLEPEVLLLRRFRNHYLLTNLLGRKLVDLYYNLSPPAADYIRRHEWLKPVVWVLLLPFIGMAHLCLDTSLIQKFLLYLVVLSLLITLFIAKRRKVV